ncbi:MAG: uroporphyrinogen-III synthase [Myxococcota bacterium]|nr:uroporphyrinogen-III synthase [Myxococcota bacterium]
MPYAVITRDVDGGSPYAEALEAALGLEAIMMPVTQTAPPDDPNELVRAMEHGGYQAIICASRHAAGAIIRAKGHTPIPEVWAVGPATARVLDQAHLSPIFPETARDGESLVRALLLQRDLVGKRVLVPRAEDGRDEGIAILREAGVLVDDIVAYRTIAVAADAPAIARGLEVLANGQAAVCCVFAPSQVAALDALIGVRKIETRYAAIGETTAEALRDAGAEVIAVAATPTPEGIAKAVASVYPQQR